MRSLFPLILLGALPAPALALQSALGYVDSAPPQATEAATHPLTGLPVQDSVVDAIYSVEETQVMLHLDELVNGIGPRLTSSSNLTEAGHWAAGRFEGWGLENVRLEKWGEFPVGFDRLYSKGRMVHPRKMKLVFSTQAWSPGTDGAVRGPAVLVPRDEEAMEALRGNLKNAWIIIPEREFSPRFDDDSEDFRAKLGHFLDEQGIAGTVTGSRGELVRTSGNSRISWDDLPHRLAMSLRQDQIGEIVRTLRAGETVELEFDIAQEFVKGPIPLYNVIAEIPGTDKADEIIIVGGHLDSWDGAGGAQDNGTGATSTLEAARLLATTLQEQGLKPRRTIRFMLWSGEEQGLLGSRAFADANPQEDALISAVLVHDGGTNACAGITATPAMVPVFEEAFAPIINHTADNEDPVLRFAISPAEYLPVGIGSDHDTYVRREVPGFFWNQRGRTNYGYSWHTQNDWVDQVAPDYQHFTARVVASSAWRLANMEQMVPRDKMLAPRPKRMGITLDGGSATIASVSEEGMASKSALQAGDVLLSIGEAAINSRRDLRGALTGEDKRLLIIWQRGDDRMAAWFDWDAETVEAAELPE